MRIQMNMNILFYFSHVGFTRQFLKYADHNTRQNTRRKYAEFSREKGTKNI